MAKRSVAAKLLQRMRLRFLMLLTQCCLLGCSWQCKEEGRAVIELTGKLDARAELASELGSNVEAKASATSLARAVVFAAPETLEDVCLVALANANTSVAHSDDNAITLLACTEVDLPFFGIFKGVGEEILDEFAHVQRACHDIAQPWRRLECEGELLVGGLGVILMVQVVHERTDIK